MLINKSRATNTGSARQLGTSWLNSDGRMGTFENRQFVYHCRKGADLCRYIIKVAWNLPQCVTLMIQLSTKFERMGTYFIPEVTTGSHFHFLVLCFLILGERPLIQNTKSHMSLLKQKIHTFRSELLSSGQCH